MKRWLYRKHNDSHAKLAALDLSQAVVEFTVDGIIIDANANFLKTFGYAIEDVRGRKHAMFVTPDHAESEEYRRFWWELAEGRFQRAEFKRIAKGGRTLDL